MKIHLTIKSQLGLLFLATTFVFSLIVTCRFAIGKQKENDSANWTRFRGDNADGVGVDNDRLPTTWTTTRNARK